MHRVTVLGKQGQASWPDSLEELASSRFNERLSQNVKWGVREVTQNTTLWDYTHIHTHTTYTTHHIHHIPHTTHTTTYTSHTHTHTNTHTETHTHLPIKTNICKYMHKP